MQSFVMLALGGYRFSVYTGGFNTMARETSWRWASQEVIGSAPRLQYIGPGDDILRIEGLILPQYRGGLGQVRAMRGQAGFGVPLLLVTGYGEVMGDHVIEKIGETKTIFMQDGAPRRIEFNIELRRYA